MARKNSEKTYDVVVVGAGPSGTSLGALLAENGLDILVIEREKFPRQKLCGGCITWKTRRWTQKKNQPFHLVWHHQVILWQNPETRRYCWWEMPQDMSILLQRKGYTMHIKAQNALRRPSSIFLPQTERQTWYSHTGAIFCLFLRSLSFPGDWAFLPIVPWDISHIFWTGPGFIPGWLISSMEKENIPTFLYYPDGAGDRL